MEWKHPALVGLYVISVTTWGVVGAAIQMSIVAMNCEGSFAYFEAMSPMPCANFHINGLVQERRNSSALTMELRLSCTNQSK